MMVSEFLDSSRYAMTADAWPPLLVGLLTALLGVAVIVRERGSRVSWTFGLMTSMVALWLLAIGTSYTTADARLAMRWIKLEHLGVVCIPTTALFFIATVARRLRACRWVLGLSVLLSLSFYATILLTDGFISGLIRYPWGWYPRYDLVSLPFLLFFFAVLLFSLSLLWREVRLCTMETAKRRFRALLLAFSIGYLGSIDYLATYGIPVYPCGYAPVFVFLVAAAYTIWRYHLVDITPAFAAAQIVDTMADGLLVLDRDGVIRVANAAAHRLFGRTGTTELVGQPITMMWSSFLSPERLSSLLQSGTLQDYETTLISRDGQEIILSLSTSVMRDPAGQPMAIVCLARDVSLRVMMQRALSQAHAQLEQRHRELQTTQLQLMQAAKLESVGRLAAGVAHEVKNPLATILVGLEHLMDHFATDDEEVQRLLQDMGHAVERADRVIRGLLDFSAPNDLVLEPTPVPVVIDQALELVRHALTKSHVTVEKHFGRALPPVPMDPPKMEQVFVNLFLNAMQAMPAGGTLGILAIRADHAGVIMEITDTGTGIPEEKLPKVFDPFFSTKPTGKGTGLGLCVTKRIVELHGGTIALQNRPTGGVQVAIVLPAEQEQASEHHPNGQEAHSARG